MAETWRGKAVHFKYKSFIEASKSGDDQQVKFKLFSSARGKFLAKNVITNDELYGRYQSFADQGQEIIKVMDQKYPYQASKKYAPALRYVIAI